MIRTSSIIFFSLLPGLAGCAHFMPRQKPEIVKQMTVVQDNLARAKAALAVDADAPYAKLEPHMIAALAAAQQAVDLAESRSVALQGKVAGAPAERMTKILKLCRDSVRSNALNMRAGGVPPGETTNLTAIMGGTCHLGRFAEALAR